MRITGDLVVSFLEAENMARLHSPITWHIDTKDGEYTVKIPSHFLSDGASVPRLLWWFLQPWGSKESRAVILHDYLIKQLRIGVIHAGCETRADIDRQFYLALRALGASKWRAKIIWLGVRTVQLKIWAKQLWLFLLSYV